LCPSQKCLESTSLNSLSIYNKVWVDQIKCTTLYIKCSKNNYTHLCTNDPRMNSGSNTHVGRAITRHDIF
jgi:hypothetical protein